MPSDWDGFVAMLDKIKAKGYTALAHGGQAWQDATIFDGVVLTTGGPDFYKKAMVDLDPEALGSDTMKTVFERMTQLRGYVDDNFSGRDWNLASAMVIEGKAGVQIMGDWAKGEFLNAGKKPGEDDCGKKGMADLAEAAAADQLMGSMAHGHAAPAAVKNALYDVVTNHFNGGMDDATAVEQLVASIQGAQ